MQNRQIVALVGKVGHGKTSILNKLTGGHFPSNVGASTCTRHLQHGPSLQHGIEVVDTPGFCASEDIAAHIAAQKVALEGFPLSGIYVVVRYARADEIGEMLTKIMNFIGSDDVRIIVTHADVASAEEGYAPDELKKRLSDILGVKQQNIAIVGKHSSSQSVEAFVEGTLHQPRSYSISEEQVSFISSLCLGTRKINKVIDEVAAKIQAATNACHELIRSGKTYDTDLAIAVTQAATSEMVRTTKENIFADAFNAPEATANLVYGKAGLSLWLKLKDFTESTNMCLSWDVADPTNPNNCYKSCPYCGAIFILEGCGGYTTCGAVPSSTKRRRPRFEAEFRGSQQGWSLAYFLEGIEVLLSSVPSSLQQYTSQKTTTGGGVNHLKGEKGTIESGCGRNIVWYEMLPIAPEKIKMLGVVEVERGSFSEAQAKENFRASLNKHEKANRGRLNII